MSTDRESAPASPTPTPASPPEGPAGRPPGRPPRRRRPWRFGLVGLVLAGLLAVVLFVGIGTGGSAPGGLTGSSGDVAPGINAASAALLDLNVRSATDPFTPPDFHLTDQHGVATSLGHYRGKVVVLSFNDDRCPDLCTLLAQAIVAANKDLGRAARHVVFLSVNVNPFYPEVRYVRSWTDQHGLGNQPNWVFGTGTVPHLEAIWKKYGVFVQLDHKTRTVVHGTELFFVDPSGRERAVGSFGTNAASTTLYAHALAQMANDLLPPPWRDATVGGPEVPAPSTTNATVGAIAPSFTLPLLHRPDRTLSSSDLEGRYSVLTFFSSHCKACAAQLAHVEGAFRELHHAAAVLGVDVSDDPSAGAAFAARAGVSFPVLSDPSGSLVRRYHLHGLPFAVILGPKGTILTRHPGSLTTEQLAYLVRNEDPALSGA